MWANILKFGTMFSVLGNLHERARLSRGPKTPQNSENNHIRVLVLLTKKKSYHETIF